MTGDGGFIDWMTPDEETEEHQMNSIVLVKITDDDGAINELVPFASLEDARAFSAYATMKDVENDDGLYYEVIEIGKPVAIGTDPAVIYDEVVVETLQWDGRTE